MAKVKKVLLNESPWGARDVIYPQTSYDQIMIKDTSESFGAIRVFPEITSEFVGKALILSSDGITYNFGEAGKVDDVRVKARPDYDESVVEKKIATLEFGFGLMVDSDGNIIINDSEVATDKDLEGLGSEFDAKIAELDDRFTSEIERLDLRIDYETGRIDSELARLDDKIDSESDRILAILTSEVNRLDGRIDSEASRLDAEILRAVNSENYVLGLLNSEISRATNSERYILSQLDAEILRATNSENYIIRLLNSEITRATNSERYILDRLDAEILRATNSEQFIINKINALDLPSTFIIEDSVDSNGNLTYRIPRYIEQEDGKVTISSEGVILGSAAAFDITQTIDDSESVAILQHRLPTASAVMAYVGDGKLDVRIRRGGSVQSEGIVFTSNQDTNTNFELVIPASVADLNDSSEYYTKHQVDNYFLKKFDSEGLLNTSEHNIIGAINEVYSIATGAGSDKQNKLTASNAGNGIIFTFASDGSFSKINIRPQSSGNPTIVVDSSGIRGNYKGSDGVIIVNNNQIRANTDDVTIHINSDGEISLVNDSKEDWLEYLLPNRSGKQGRALALDSQGNLWWDDVGHIDILDVAGSESLVTTNGKIVTINQIDGSIISGVVDEAIKATVDSEGRDFVSTYQTIANLAQGLGSESNKYPSVRAVKNALDLKQDILTAGDAIDSAQLRSNVIKVRYDGRTIVLATGSEGGSEGTLKTRDIQLVYLNGHPYLVDIVPNTTESINPLVNEADVNDKLLQALGTFRGSYTSEGLIPKSLAGGGFPQNNDYAYVTYTIADSEGHTENMLARYKCVAPNDSQGPTSEGDVQWSREYTISLGSGGGIFTSQQLAAINSKVTAYIVSEGIVHMMRTDNPHNVTAAQLGLGPFKNKTFNDVISEGLTINHINRVVGASNSNPILLTSEGYRLFKVIQTPKSSPNATSEASIAYIDTITQNAQGVITATKKTIPNASNTRPGLMTAAQKIKLDSIEDGATKVQVSNINGHIKINNSEALVYELPIATSARLGGVKIGEGIDVASDGTISSNGTTYTFTSGTDGSFTVTPDNGSAQVVKVLPVTGSEGNGRYLHKNSVNGTLEWSAVSTGGGGNDGLLYIKVNGSTVTPSGGNFSANTVNNVTYDLTVPVPGTGLELGTASGRTNVFNHSNSVTAVTTIPTTSINNLKYDAQGHITGVTQVTGDTTNGVQIVGSKIQHTNILAAANTTSGLKYFTYDKNGHVTASVDKTLGRGIDDQSNVIGHSNSITAGTLNNNAASVTDWSSVKDIIVTKAPYDAQGHITGTVTDITYDDVGQSNWDENTTTKFSYIKNRPNIKKQGGGFVAENTLGVVIGNIGSNTASGIYSLAEGSMTSATSEGSHAEGYNTASRGLASHAEGNGPIAWAEASHAEGLDTNARAIASHAEGDSSDASGERSHAEGDSTRTLANSGASHAEGEATVAGGLASHAEGYQTVTAPLPGGSSHRKGAHAEGSGTYAAGRGAHAEGEGSRAENSNSHAEGYFTRTTATSAHAEGNTTIASESAAHAEGTRTNATALNAHAEGTGTTASGTAAHAEGNVTYAVGASSHAEGYQTVSSEGGEGQGAHAEGYQTYAAGKGAHAEGELARALKSNSHAEGYSTEAGTSTSGWSAHAEGNTTKAYANNSHAEGCRTTVAATAGNAHAEGYETTASGGSSHAEGFQTSAAGTNSHTEGQTTRTSSTATAAHAEGFNTQANGQYSHAEGQYTIASGLNAHTEGYQTRATSNNAHAEGVNTEANSQHSHAEGVYTTTPTNVQGSHVEGTYNNISMAEGQSSEGFTLVSITGIGTSPTNRINGSALTTTGDLRIKGKVLVGCNNDSTGGTELGGRHYGLCTLPVTSEGTYTAMPTFDDGYVMKNNEHPFVDVLCTDATTAQDELEAWSCVYRARVNANGSITFYLLDVTTYPITVQVCL